MRKAIEILVKCVLFSCFFFPVRSYGQPAVTVLGIEEGLSENSVRCIFKDSKGFMWLGTYDGLNRYDGYGFKIFRNVPGDSSSLSHNMVFGICEAPSGKLWVSTEQGVSVYDPLLNRFSRISYISDAGKTELLKSVSRSAAVNKNGDAFLATEGQGLMYVKNGNAPAVQVPLMEKGKLLRNYGVTSVKTDQQSKVWVLVQNKGVFSFNINNMTLESTTAIAPGITAMEVSGLSIFLGTGNGVFRFQPPKGQLEKVLDAKGNELSSTGVYSLFSASDGFLWICSRGEGLIGWNEKLQIKKILRPGQKGFSVLSSVIYSCYVDDESRIWVGTDKHGLNILDPQKEKFRPESGTWTSITQLNEVSVSAFAGQGKKIWVGTSESGLWSVDKKGELIAHNATPLKKALTDNTINWLLSDQLGDVWIATFKSGIYKYNPVSGSLHPQPCMNSVTGFENKAAMALYEDKAGDIWAGTLRQGTLNEGALYKFDRQRAAFMLFDKTLSDLFSLKEDSKGNFWGGNLKQLVKIDRLNKKHLFAEIGHVVKSLHEDKQGNFWIGTAGGGLVLFDRSGFKVIKRFTSTNGLCNNSIHGILEDDQGYLWLSTFNGLSRFNPLTGQFINYYKNDGLQSSQFNPNAVLKTAEGELVFGGINGLNIFRAGKISGSKEMAQLVFSGIRVNGRELRDDDFEPGKEMLTLKVDYDEAVVSIDYTALEYTSPENISYAYYMDGFDRNWSFPTRARTATYTHLSEGEYVFKVKCTNPEGKWNNRYIQMSITVFPPWYRSTLAYILYFLGAVSLIYGFVRFRSRQTRLTYEYKISRLNAEKEKTKFELERAEYETERIRNEHEKKMNEKKFTFFSSIAHEFRTPLTLIVNPLKDLAAEKEHLEINVKEQLDASYRNARRMLSLVDQLLLFQKAESGLDVLNTVKLDFVSLCREVYLCFVQQAKNRNIHYRFIAPDNPIEMVVDREKIEIVLYNLLSNAIKYCRVGGDVELLLKVDEHKVEVLVSDTGIGVPEDAGEKIFEKFYQGNDVSQARKTGFGIGLYLVKHFMELHKGQVTYSSVHNEGTVFRLLLEKNAILPEGENEREGQSHNISLLKELVSDEEDEQDLPEKESASAGFEPFLLEKNSLLIVDDEEDMRRYIIGLFEKDFHFYEAVNGVDALKIARKHQPDIIISDIKMEGGTGIDLCKSVKNDPSLNHIPLILLTGTPSQETKLQGVEGGADDYITKPFEKDLLVARVFALIRNRANLQNYFLNEVTMNNLEVKVPQQYKEFLEKCIQIVEAHFDDDNFNIKVLAREMGMSHSSVYKKIKLISGQSLSGFIRFIRLRKAARLFIDSNLNITEVGFQVGMNDAKYFRKHFIKVFGMKPSDYIRKYRKNFQEQYTIQKKEE